MSHDNSQAWGEIAQFLEEQGLERKTPIDLTFLEDPDYDDVHEVNDHGETADLDEDDVPEGFYRCDGCGSVELEEEANSTTYGAVCDYCLETDSEDY